MIVHYINGEGKLVREYFQDNLSSIQFVNYEEPRWADNNVVASGTRETTRLEVFTLIDNNGERVYIASSSVHEAMFLLSIVRQGKLGVQANITTQIPLNQHKLEDEHEAHIKRQLVYTLAEELIKSKHVDISNYIRQHTPFDKQITYIASI